MKNLLYKEFRLLINPQVLMFYIMSILLTIIPTQPCYITFLYTCVGVIMMFINGAVNNDLAFSVTLPFSKKEIVKARFTVIALYELTSIIFSVPFMILSVYMPTAEGVVARPAANAASIGINFIFAASVNFFFLSMCFRKANNKCILEIVITSVIYFLLNGIIGLLVHFKTPVGLLIDSMEASDILKQIPILIAGIIIWSISFLVTFPVAVNKFNKVDL